MTAQFIEMQYVQVRLNVAYGRSERLKEHLIYSIAAAHFKVKSMEDN